MGGFLALVIAFIMTFASLPSSDQGGCDVSISSTQHPKPQISADFPYPLLSITSGAIQNGEPMTLLVKPSGLVSKV